jgi:flagellar hook-associated protein 1 FlgK
MSITSAMSAALTGLSATSRQAEVLASNLANATTPGYGRREVDLRAAVLAGTGQGVSVAGVTREIDVRLMADRRLSEAAAGDRDARTDLAQRVERAFGTADSPGSLSAKVAAFDQALVTAAARPEAEARLDAVAITARDLASGLQVASRDIQAARTDADRQIADQVGLLNTTLARIQDLNGSLLGFTTAGRDIAALLDERQRLVDTVAAIVPLREVPRDGNQIALYTVMGAPLLEGRAATFGFTPTRIITPEMTLAAGGLSGLTINGRMTETGGSLSPIHGGSLGALFAVRDDLAVAAQGQLDAVARDLVERFSTASPDPTLLPGDPGLFTDQGAAFLPANEVGLSARIALNPLADPAQGGALFRLRDGLGAATPGPPGNGALLSALHQGLGAGRPLASAAFTAGTRSFAVLASDLMSHASTRRLAAETDQSFTAGRMTALKEIEAKNGIDTDREMQDLLVVEKNYGANARVIQTLDEMIDILIRLGG